MDQYIGANENECYESNFLSSETQTFPEITPQLLHFFRWEGNCLFSQSPAGAWKARLVFSGSVGKIENGSVATSIAPGSGTKI